MDRSIVSALSIKRNAMKSLPTFLMSATYAGVILAVALTSCAPYTAIVPTRPQIAAALAPGSIVRLSVKGDTFLEDFRVVALDSEKISVCARGRERKSYQCTIPISQIETIEARGDILRPVADTVMVVVAENRKNHKTLLLGVGHTIYFKTYGATRLEKGWISSISDSSISLYTRVRGRTTNLTLPFSKLKMLVIPNQGIIDFGSVAIVGGSSVLAYGLLSSSMQGLPFTPSGAFDSTNRNIPVKGLGFIAIGVIMKTIKIGKKIDLTGLWTISTRVISSKELPEVQFSDAIPLEL